MNDHALADLLRRELPALVRQAVRDELERLAPPVDPRHADLLRALAVVYGAAPFTAAEAIATARGALPNRAPLRAALQAVGAFDAQRLGLILAAIEKRAYGLPVRLSRLGTDGGKRLWTVDQVGPGST